MKYTPSFIWVRIEPRSLPDGVKRIWTKAPESHSHLPRPR